MISQNVSNTPAPAAAPSVCRPGPAVRWTVRGLALVALCMAGYLCWLSWQEPDAMIGCGGGLPALDCRHVLTSRWSYWLGMPVSVPAAAAYTAILAASLSIGPRASVRARRAGWIVLLLLAPMAAGAALWFLGLMLLVVKKGCLQCLIAHACGLSIAGLVVWCVPDRRHALRRDTALFGTAGVRLLCLLGLVGTGMLIGGQWLFPPKLYRIEEHVRAAAVEDPPGDPTVASVSGEDGPPGPPTAEGPAAGPRREVKILSGDVTLNAYDHPILGDPEAEHVVVNMSDYSCKHCRSLHAHLDQARRRYGQRLAVVVLLVPMNTHCNRFVSSTHKDHKKACEYARLAMAVWAADRSKFEQLHQRLFKPSRPPLVHTSTAYARQLVGQAALDKHLKSSSVTKQIRSYTELYKKAGGGKIPKMLWGKQIFTGHTTTAKQLFDLFEREMGIAAEDP